jgi:hypothetical protein
MKNAAARVSEIMAQMCATGAKLQGRAGHRPKAADLVGSLLGRIALLRGRRASGLFLCHAPTDPVMAHFARLERESADFVAWRLVADEGHLNDPGADADAMHASRLMPVRFAQARARGRLTDGAGMMDTVIMPRVLAAAHPFVWAMEYDVDYSGHWSELFRRFAANRADLLTTTLLPRERCRDWALWGTAQAPREVEPSQWFRSFSPIMRLSRRLAAAYVQATNTADWAGHYEFTVPTIARHTGLRVEDIAHVGKPPPVYHNTPADPTLSPGTFVWRPPRGAYFHQRPSDFPQRNRLYHPIKPQL